MQLIGKLDLLWQIYLQQWSACSILECWPDSQRQIVSTVILPIFVKFQGVHFLPWTWKYYLTYLGHMYKTLTALYYRELLNLMARSVSCIIYDKYLTFNCVWRLKLLTCRHSSQRGYCELLWGFSRFQATYTKHSRVHALVNVILREILRALCTARTAVSVGLPILTRPIERRKITWDDNNMLYLWHQEKDQDLCTIIKWHKYVHVVLFKVES